MPPNDVATAPPITPPTGLQQALQRATRGGLGQAALRVRLGDVAPPVPRLVRHVLEDAARGRGIHLLAPADFLLAEASLDVVREARGAIAALLPGAQLPEMTQWTLPEDAVALRALAAEAGPIPPQPAPPLAPLRGLDARADGIALAAVVRRSPVLALAAPGQLQAGPVRLGIRHDALRPALGPAGPDADLLRHARDRIARRLLGTLGDARARRELLGGGAPRRIIVEVAPNALPVRGKALDELAETRGTTRASVPALIAALPPSVAADPDALARCRGALEAHGWGLALRGLTAPLLTALAAETLVADLLLLRWSPDLAARGPAAVARRIDPARIVLLGADEEEAMRWGLAQGIRQFGGTHPELILGAARMAACPARSQCTRRQCIQRAAATGPDGREGCTNRTLLAAILPEAELAA